MTVLVYLEHADVRGGIEIFAERQIAQRRAEGCEVAVVSTPPADFSDFDEVVVHKCSDIDTLAKFPPEKTTYYVHDHEPICPRGYAYTPLKHNCSRPGGVWPCLLCAAACRNWKAALRRVFSQGRRKAIMARFNKVVVISQFMKSRLVANGIPAEHIVVSPPTITPARVQSVPEPCDLLYVGQLIRGKGVHLLLAAMARMTRQATLDVVGTGNMQDELKALAERLGLGARVTWHGFQPNPQDWMCRAKCVVVPSFWQEPYGLVAAEAVALGRKTVVFDIGGLKEASQGKATLVPPGDIDALAKALEDV